uniref:Uncharacterized protein n=1 Tax=Arundo donax TaxID=35708 RepID=A0A0A9CNL0_ARUDO
MIIHNFAGHSHYVKNMRFTNTLLISTLTFLLNSVFLSRRFKPTKAPSLSIPPTLTSSLAMAFFFVPLAPIPRSKMAKQSALFAH